MSASRDVTHEDLQAASKIRARQKYASACVARRLTANYPLTCWNIMRKKWVIPRRITAMAACLRTRGY